MRNNVELFLMGIGAILLAVLTYELIALLGEASAGIVLTATLVLLGVWVRRYVTLARRRRKVKQAERKESPQIAALILELRGEYPPYIIEAAQALGQARDRTAVPALLNVLEQAAENQRPGWRDVAAALADALAEIGDGRALELLYRLENVRGIGFIPNIRRAIAVIEPQSVLLRASSENASVQSALLLRPTRGAGEADKSLLLRATESETR